MKMKRVCSVIIFAFLLVCVSACDKTDDASRVPTPTSIPATQSKLIKPNVSSVPSGWYLSNDNASLRSLEYRNNGNDDFVRIHYGVVPNTLVGDPTNGNALMDQVGREAPFTATNKSWTAVDGRPAGWAQAYNVTSDSYQTEIVFVINNTYIEAYALCRLIRLSEVGELIHSIR